MIWPLQKLILVRQAFLQDHNGLRLDRYYNMYYLTKYKHIQALDKYLVYVYISRYIFISLVPVFIDYVSPVVNGTIYKYTFISWKNVPTPTNYLAIRIIVKFMSVYPDSKDFYLPTHVLT